MPSSTFGSLVLVLVSLDPSRLVTGASGWVDHDVGKINLIALPRK